MVDDQRTEQPFADAGSTGGLGLNLSFRTRLTVGLVAASLIPLAGFGTIVIILGGPEQTGTLGRLLLFVLVIAAMIGILLAWLLAADLTAPLRAIAAAVDRASAGIRGIGHPTDRADDDRARVAAPVAGRRSAEGRPPRELLRRRR